MRAIALRVLLVLASLTAALLLGEIGVRLLVPQPLLHDPDAFVPDPALGARLKPGFRDQVVTTEFRSTWDINADGHRGPRAGEGGSGALRVAALGDSFTFGYGVEEEEAWPRRLERRLNDEHPARRIEVINLGVGGYGTFQQTAWLEETLSRWRPDLAIVAFYVGNDPQDNARWEQTHPHPPAMTTAAATLDPEPGAAGPDGQEPLKRWLGARSQLYNLVATRADELLVRLRLRRLVYPFEMEILRVEAAGEVRQAWESTGRAFDELAAVSRGAGVRVAVIIVPMKHQVSDEVWKRLASHFGGLSSAPDRFDRDLPQHSAATLCERAGLSCFDLLPGLRDAAAREGDGAGFYWLRDQHWTARGHAEAASIIAEELFDDF